MLGSLESEGDSPTEEARKTNVCAAKNRLEVVEEELVRQILNIKLEIDRGAVLLKEICADRQVQNGPRLYSATLKIDLIVYPRIKTSRRKLSKRGSGQNVSRNA